MPTAPVTPLRVGGTITTTAPPHSIAGYVVAIALNRALGEKADELLLPVGSYARVDAAGEFVLEVGGEGVARGPAVVTVAAPAGVEVFRQAFDLEALDRPLRLAVAPIPRVRLEPSDDPALGARIRLHGQVIDERGRPVPSKLAVVVSGAAASPTGGEAPLQVLAVTETQVGGHFDADWPADRLARAVAKVATADAVPVSLDADGRLPRRMLVVLDIDDIPEAGEDGRDCSCDDVPPRAPDPADVVSNPAAFSQDLGGGCVDLTTPNRTLEEFSYFVVVRTTEPRVRGVTLRGRRTIPTDVLVDLLGVSIAFHALRNPSAGLARTALPIEGLSLDVAAARQLVRSDRPPTVEQIGRAVWLSEVSSAKEVIQAGTSTVAARAVLDADSAVDWDDTPTIHLALDVAHGHLVQYREVWRADGYSLGDLLYSLPLAPGQRRQVAVVDWDRRSSSGQTESLEFEEELDALLARDRDIAEIVGTRLHEETSGGSRNTTWGVAGGIGAGFIGSGFGIFGGVAGGASGSDTNAWQRSARTFSADSQQRLRDRVSQRASSLRSLRSSVVQTVAQGETFRAETEVVANYNRCHAITIEYFEVLRHFIVTHEVAGVQECLFVPLPIAQFDRGKALRWREPLRRYLRERRLLAGFDAIERIADDWDGWDFPVARYSEEAPESLEGELRVSFLLPRPRDAEDGKFQVDMWRGFGGLLPVDALEVWTAKINAREARERDRVFRTEIAPEIARRFVQKLRFAYVTADGGEHDIALDATLVSRYAERTPLYVSLNPLGPLAGLPREDIAHFKIWYDGSELPPDAQIVVQAGKVRYRCPHSTALLFDNPRILNDIRAGDPVLIATPVSRAELRNPRQEDRDLAARLVAHLNEHLEFYHQALWTSLDAQRRYMLLDAVLVPGLGGRSVASVCTNELIGIAGNCLVLPVAPGQRLDPLLEELGTEDAPVDLINAYATPPAPPLRVSVPTRGVYAEAVSGACNACETVDDTRYWRWSEDGLLAPPAIAEVATESRAADEPTLTPTPLPNPLVSIQNAPAVPDPVGLRGAFELLARPELFRDITGLAGTQRNARAAFDSALSAASAMGDEAARLATQQELGKNAGRMIDRIATARRDGLLTPGKAQELTESALKGLIGAPRSDASHPAANPTVDKVVDEAAQSGKADITVTSPSETVEVSFDDSASPIVGSGAPVPPGLLDVDEMVPQPVLVEPDDFVAADAIPFVFDTYDLIARFKGAELPPIEARGFVAKDPARPGRFTVRRRLRIVFPAAAADRSRVGGNGRLPVAVLVHGHHKSWSTTGETLNHEGYTYLQEELARHGIVSVSVDTNAANWFGSLIEMRAQMVMGALDHLRTLDATAGSPFHRRLDLDRVALMGHSRGGDAVVRAAHMNRSRPADRKYGVQAVCALAPTDCTGMLATPRTLGVAETPFFAVVYGALDGDVSGVGGAKDGFGTGFRHYDRATCDKAMVFIDHCNHNRFNTVWTADGDDYGMVDADVAAGGRLLSPADHQRLAIDYIGGLFRWKLLRQTARRGLFDGTLANGAGAGVSLQFSFGALVEPLDDFEDPLRPRTLNGAFVDPLADVIVTGTRTLALETNHQTAVLAVDPNRTSATPFAYAVSVPSRLRDWSGFDALTLRVGANFDLTSVATIGNGRLPDCRIVIVDSNGASAAIPLTAVSTPAVPRPPVFHLAVTSRDPVTGAAISTENCTAIRLETISIPRALMTGIDPASVATVAIEAPVGFPQIMFFDSFQLVRA